MRLLCVYVCVTAMSDRGMLGRMRFHRGNVLRNSNVSTSGCVVCSRHIQCRWRVERVHAMSDRNVWYRCWRDVTCARLQRHVPCPRWYVVQGLQPRNQP